MADISLFGKGIYKSIPGIIKSKKLQKSFIISETILAKLGVVGMITNLLGLNKIEYEEFIVDDSLPPTTNIKNSISSFKKSRADNIIAVGDHWIKNLSKLVALMADNPDFLNISIANKKKELTTLSPVTFIVSNSREITESLNIWSSLYPWRNNDNDDRSFLFTEVWSGKESLNIYLVDPTMWKEPRKRVIITNCVTKNEKSYPNINGACFETKHIWYSPGRRYALFELCIENIFVLGKVIEQREKTVVIEYVDNFSEFSLEESNINEYWVEWIILDREHTSPVFMSSCKLVSWNPESEQYIERRLLFDNE